MSDLPPPSDAAEVVHDVNDKATKTQRSIWLVGAGLAGLGRLPDAYRARVQFAKPIALPSSVGFAAARQDPGWAFAVVGKEGKPHLVGEIAEG